MSEEIEYVWYQEIESGEWVQISKKTWLSMHHMMQKVQSMIDPDKKIKGTIQIISTMRDETDSNIGLNEDRDGRPTGLTGYFTPQYPKTDKFGNIIEQEQ